MLQTHVVLGFQWKVHPRAKCSSLHEIEANWCPIERKSYDFLILHSQIVIENQLKWGIQESLQDKVCLIFNCIVRAKVAQSITSRDRDSRPFFNFNNKFMFWCVAGCSDIALWWSQWLLQVQFTFVFEKNPLGGGDLISTLKNEIAK